MLYLASTVLVPISNVMFALPCMPQHQPVHTTDVWGLLVIMLGLTLYRAGQQIASRLSERWCSLQTKAAPLFDLEGGVPTPILRGGSIAGSVPESEDGRRARPSRADQLEMLQPIYEQQERQARGGLVKTNAQIRHTLLRRLGFSPDTSGVPIPGRDGSRRATGGGRRGGRRLCRRRVRALSERRRARSFQARSFIAGATRNTPSIATVLLSIAYRRDADGAFAGARAARAFRKSGSICCEGVRAAERLRASVPSPC